MARTKPLLVTALAACLLASFVAWAAWIALAPAPPDASAPASDVADAADAAECAECAEIERLQRRIDELERLLTRRERARVRRPAPGRSEEPASADGATAEAEPPTPDSASDEIARAISRSFLGARARAPGQPSDVVPTAAAVAAPVDLDRLSDGELLEHARSLKPTNRSELVAARETWQALVDRDPAYEILDPALFGLGIAHRKLGEHDAELEVFARLGDLVGPHTERGEQARYQRAWSHYYSGAFEDALRDMESIADASDGRTDLARHALLNGSAFADRAGDPGRSRAMLERLLRAVEDESGGLSRFFAEQARSRLAKLE